MFLALAAAVPLGSWGIFLFVAPSAGMTLADSAVAQLRYSLSSESPSQWWFVLWAALPWVLLVLAVAHFRGQPHPLAQRRVLFGIAIGLALASTYLWPSLVVPLLAASYYAFRYLRAI
jgi:hypothetical protein